MAASERCTAVLLDMDGTLVDSHRAVENVWGRWAQENGLDIAAVTAACHGREVAATIRLFRPDLDDAAVRATVELILRRECSELTAIRPALGAAELLSWLELRNVPWAVVTNSAAPLAHARLGAAGIDPPELVTLDDVGQGKPAPEGYLLAARRLGVNPHEAIAVEDSPAGLAAARAAGTTVVAVGGARDADVVCADLADVHRHVVRVLGDRCG